MVFSQDRRRDRRRGRGEPVMLFSTPLAIERARLVAIRNDSSAAEGTADLVAAPDGFSRG